MTRTPESNPVRVRASAQADHASIEALYPRSFPDEDLLPLVRDLLQGRDRVTSLVAVSDGDVIGHILFTHCATHDSDAPGALLAPLAVAPDRQRQGVGSALVREGLRQLRCEGVTVVYVLGDPAYYGRLGFAPERSVTPPYPLPDEWTDAWQSLQLGSTMTAPSGRLRLPERWLDPALWTE